MSKPRLLSDAEVLADRRRARDVQIHARIRTALGRNARAERLIAEVLSAVHHHDQLGEEER